ncbi:MAG TPA: class I SAM-dependent methyltransferase [Candidatus Saccharimonadales bacterium]|nr:class I SAM-dependent methyltransferase [Candidatus Saccharimonadales bacterium]
MKLRRLINETYAVNPVDFNEMGLRLGEEVLGRMLTCGDVVVDIGSSSGEMIADAALSIGVQARILCVEPNTEAAELYSLLSDEQRSRIDFVQGIGEQLPLRDNSAAGASLHNVIFRASDAKAMLNEAKRVVKPGGFIAISSNQRGHGDYRHTRERAVAEQIVAHTGVMLKPLLPPAEGYYLDDLPTTVEEVGGLKIMPDMTIRQVTEAKITRGERLENYLDSIKYSAANVDLPPQYRNMWRTIVDVVVRQEVEGKIDESEQAFRALGRTEEPYFADRIWRGMFMLRNEKTA